MSALDRTRTLIGLDLDGTLEDSRDDMVSAARRVRGQLALPVRSDAQLRPWVNGGMDQLYRECFDDYLALAASPEEAASRFSSVRLAYEAEYIENVAIATRLYQGVDAALRQLHALGTLACITNKPERISRRLLEVLGVSELFSTVIGGDTCAEAKPHPMMISAAFERAGVAPGARVFMIGDSAGDVQMARAFGAKSVWCAWGYVDAIPEPADFVAKKPADLIAIVTRG